MSRIKMEININNESDATLTFVRDEILSGDYTPGWRPPAVVNPGQRIGFQGEGDLTLVPTTGTQGGVWYNIVNPDGHISGELIIHWNSPLVESDYDNTFHIYAPPDWEVTHSGGQGHHAILEVRLRRSARRSVPGFNPRGRGFVFLNRDWDETLPVVTLGKLWNELFAEPLEFLGIPEISENFLPITRADAGLCGGMVFAVMDYFYSHLLPPDQVDKPSSRYDILFEHIRDRLWDSFDVTGEGHRWLGYSSPHYPNGDEGVIQAVGLARGRSWITYREAWPQIQEDIDAGRLSPVGLIQTTNLDLGKNHQVLAYGYMKSGQMVTLFIYDPNYGQVEVVYKFDITHTDGEVHIERSHGADRIWCLFRTNGYTIKEPPNGRHTKSVKEVIRASTMQNAPYSVRAAMVGSNGVGSVTNWMRSL